MSQVLWDHFYDVLEESKEISKGHLISFVLESLGCVFHCVINLIWTAAACRRPAEFGSTLIEIGNTIATENWQLFIESSATKLSEWALDQIEEFCPRKESFMLYEKYRLVCRSVSSINYFIHSQPEHFTRAWHVL